MTRPRVRYDRRADVVLGTDAPWPEAARSGSLVHVNLLVRSMPYEQDQHKGFRSSDEQNG